MKVTCGALTAVLILGLLAGPIATEAQQPAGRRLNLRTNIVSPEDAVTQLFDAFKQGLREQGYVLRTECAF